MIKFLSLIIILLGLFIKCSSISVNSDYDVYVDFTHYKSFYIYRGFLKNSKLETVPLVKKRVLDAIESQLLSIGFLETDSAKANLTIFAMANTADKMNVSSYGYGYGYGWGPYPYGRNIDVSYYTEASLIIDFVDSKKKQLVWRGIGTSVAKSSGTPEERDQFINEAVTKILDQFPPEK